MTYETEKEMNARHARERAEFEARQREPDKRKAAYQVYLDRLEPGCAGVDMMFVFYAGYNAAERDLAALAPAEPVDVEALAVEIEGKWWENGAGTSISLARLAIRETLTRAPVAAWPGEERDVVLEEAAKVAERTEMHIPDSAGRGGFTTRCTAAATAIRDLISSKPEGDAASEKLPPIRLQIEDPGEEYWKWNRRWKAMKALNFHDTKFSDQDGRWTLSDFIAYAGEACGFTLPDMTRKPTDGSRSGDAA